MSERWFILQSNARPAAENMAADEALLELVGGIGRPVLRFYGWTEPAATFGYSQRYADIERWTPLRPLIRRPTGGGLVPHNADWTYSLVFPTSHPWYELKAVDSYRQAHEWVQNAFQKLKIGVELSPCCQKDIPGQCFIGAEKFDVLWSGKKIAGAAQRRNRLGLLIQGSVQPPPGLGRAHWEEAMLRCVPEYYQAFWEPLERSEEFKLRVEELVRMKYSQVTYNQQR